MRGDISESQRHSREMMAHLMRFDACRSGALLEAG